MTSFYSCHTWHPFGKREPGRKPVVRVARPGSTSAPRVEVNRAAPRNAPVMPTPATRAVARTAGPAGSVAYTRKPLSQTACERESQGDYIRPTGKHGEKHARRRRREISLPNASQGCRAPIQNEPGPIAKRPRPPAAMTGGVSFGHSAKDWQKTVRQPDPNGQPTGEKHHAPASRKAASVARRT